MSKKVYAAMDQSEYVIVTKDHSAYEKLTKEYEDSLTGEDEDYGSVLESVNMTTIKLTKEEAKELSSDSDVVAVEENIDISLNSLSESKTSENNSKTNNNKADKNKTDDGITAVNKTDNSKSNENKTDNSKTATNKTDNNVTGNGNSYGIVDYEYAEEIYEDFEERYMELAEEQIADVDCFDSNLNEVLTSY